MKSTRRFRSGSGFYFAGFVAVFVLANPIAAQEIGGSLIQDPSAGTVTYDFHFNVPASQPEPFKAALLPLLDPLLIDPDSLIAPPGWSFQLVNPLPNAEWWNWNPAGDPKLGGNAQIFGPDPNVWINPPAFLLMQAQNPAAAIQPGANLGGFQFKSAFGPRNAPAQVRDIQDQVFNADPPMPDPTQPIGAGVPSLDTQGRTVLVVVLIAASAWFFFRILAARKGFRLLRR